MKWTKEFPKVGGAYWRTRPPYESRELVWVWIDPVFDTANRNLRVYLFGHTAIEETEVTEGDSHFYWNGPIPIPEWNKGLEDKSETAFNPQAKAWQLVYERCLSLGMNSSSKSGQETVLDFIEDFHKKAVAWNKVASFCSSLGLPLSDSGGNTQRVLDFIKELHEKEGTSTPLPNSYTYAWVRVYQTCINMGLAVGGGENNLDAVIRFIQELQEKAVALEVQLKGKETLLETERTKYETLSCAVKEHHSQKADDRCWLDDTKLYDAAGLPTHDARVGDKFEMMKNCAHFIDKRCEGGGWATYAELETVLKKCKSFVGGTVYSAESKALYDELVELLERGSK